MEDHPLIRNIPFGLNVNNVLLLYQATGICSQPVRASWVALTNILHHLFGLMFHMLLLSIIFYSTSFNLHYVAIFILSNSKIVPVHILC